MNAILAVASVKHSPGVTTSAVALAVAAGPRPVPLVVELDPAGGDLGARGGMSLEPGLASLAASTRHGGALDIAAHTQPLAAGPSALLAPTSPASAVGAFESIGPRLLGALREWEGTVVIDCGRWSPISPLRSLVAEADAFLLVLRPTVEGVEHVRTRLDELQGAGSGMLGALLVGDRPYGPAEVEAALGIPVAGALAHDPRGAQGLERRMLGGDTMRSRIRPLGPQRPRSNGGLAGGPGGDLGVSALPTPDEALVVRFQSAVARALAGRTTAAERSGARPLDLDDQQALARRFLNDELERYATERMTAGKSLLAQEDEEAVAQAVFDRLFALGRLQALVDDQRFTDIMANGYDDVWLVDADGRKVPGPPLAESDEEFIELLREIGRRSGLSEREFNPGRPSLNVTLPDGSRLFAVAWVCERPCLAIRRHRHLKVTLAELRSLGTVDRGLEAFLRAAVRARKQILVAGATGAGKTTLLRALAAEIPPDERIVTIETELELGLNRFADLHADCVALEAREANVEGVGEVTAADLVRMSLRMNPDRVIVGEVRGAEVVPLLNAMSQGNEGSMCTIHADSSATVFNKLALYAIQSPERLPIEATNLLASSAVHLVVWLAKSPHGRFVGSVRQVVHADGAVVVTNELFRPGPDGRAVPGDPIPVDLLARLVDAGYDPDLHLRPEGWWQ